MIVGKAKLQIKADTIIAFLVLSLSADRIFIYNYKKLNTLGYEVFFVLFLVFKYSLLG